MSKNFPDPASNAKGFGIIWIIFGALVLLFILFGNSFAVESESASINPLWIIEGISLIVAGYGLYSKKLFGIHLLGLLLLMPVLTLIYNLSQGLALLESFSFTLIIYAVSFIWFWSGRKDFS